MSSVGVNFDKTCACGKHRENLNKANWCQHLYACNVLNANYEYCKISNFFQKKRAFPEYLNESTTKRQRIGKK